MSRLGAGNFLFSVTSCNYELAPTMHDCGVTFAAGSGRSASRASGLYSSSRKVGHASVGSIRNNKSSI